MNVVTPLSTKNNCGYFPCSFEMAKSSLRLLTNATLEPSKIQWGNRLNMVSALSWLARCCQILEFLETNKIKCFPLVEEEGVVGDIGVVGSTVAVDGWLCVVVVVVPPPRRC